MKKRTKILVLILSLAIICAGLVIAVSADTSTPDTLKYIQGGQEKTGDIRTAIANADAGSTVTLLGDVTVNNLNSNDYGITIAKTLTLDLNGYTLESNITKRIFNLQHKNAKFTITGEGTITTNAGPVFVCAGTTTYPGTETAVIGTGKGITINNNGTGNLAQVKMGNYEIKNVVINTTSTATVFNSNAIPADGLNVNFALTGVEINSKGNCKASSAVVNLQANDSVSLNYCKIDTAGQSAFIVNDQQTAVENFILVENSLIAAAWNPTSGSAPNLIGISGSTGTIASDIVFRDSILNYNSAIMIKNIIGGSMITFDGTDVIQNSNANSFFQSCNVMLINGSSLRVSDSRGKLATKIFNSDVSSEKMTVGENTAVQLLLSEGTRFNDNAYYKMQNRVYTNSTTNSETGEVTTTSVVFYADGAIAYPDGSTPASSENYKIVYDPIGNPDAPYVVATKDAPDSTVPNSISFENSPTSRFDYNTAGVRGSTKINYNNAWRYLSDGTAATAGYCGGWGLAANKGLSTTEGNVYVFDFDVATDSDVGFVDMDLTVHSRGTASGSDDYSNNSYIHVAQDGTVTLINRGADGKSNNDVVTDVKLALNEWNHITYVVDTRETQGTAYIYVNGEYVGARYYAYKAGAFLSSVRINMIPEGQKKTGASVLVDNVLTRAYSSPAAMENNGAGYLLNEGKAWNAGSAVGYAMTVAGLPMVEDVDAALKFQNETGINVKLNQNVVTPQTVATNGVIYTNGYTIVTTDESYEAKVKLDADNNVIYYDFNSEYHFAPVQYLIFVGNVDVESELEDETKWVTVEVPVGAVITDLYTDYLESKMIKSVTEAGTYFPFVSHIGWSVTNGASAPDEFNVVTEEYTSEMYGKVIKLYPVYGNPNYKYSWVVTDLDGNFKRAGTATTFYGSHWATRTDGHGVNLKYNEIFILQKDITMVGFSPVRDTTVAEANRNYYIDLNGRTIQGDVRQNNSWKGGKNAGMFAVSTAGETLNLYSSAPGGTFYTYAYNSSTNFTLVGNSVVDLSANNTTANIGEVTVGGVTYSGSNLTVGGGYMTCAYRTNVSGCTLNVKGITYEAIAPDYAAVFMSRESTTNIYVEDATILAPNQTIAQTRNNTYGKDTYVQYPAEMIFRNCTFLMGTNGRDIISVDKNATEKTVIFENCVTNGTINGGTIGEGNKAYAITGAVADGLVKAKYNLPIDLGEGITTVTTNLVSAKAEQKAALTWSTKVFGISGAEADISVADLAYAVIKAEDAHTVTWNGVPGSEVVNEYYANGGKLIAITSGDVALNAVKLVYTGWAEELAANVTENLTYNATYDVVSNVSGLKANLSLYSDFVVNLYIPAIYADYIEVTGEEENSVTIQDASYVKATIEILAKDAANDAVFTINITEGEYTATATVSLSIVKYASSILEGEYSDANKILMYYMLNYANEAVKYFGGAYVEEITNLITANSEYAINSDATAGYENAIEGVNEVLAPAFNYATVRLEEAPAFVLNIKEGFVGTVTVTYGQGNVRTFTIKTAGDAEDLVVEGMKIYNFGTTLTITAEGTIGETAVNVSGTYNLDTFAKYHSDVVNGVITENITDEMKANSEAALELIEALYDYVEIAEQYKAGTLAMPEDEPAAGDEVVEGTENGSDGETA